MDDDHAAEVVGASRPGPASAAWAALIVSVLPPAVGYLIWGPQPGEWMPGIAVMVSLGGGALFALGLVNLVLLTAALWALAERTAAGARGVRGSPVDLLQAAAPALAHLAVLAVGKAVAVALLRELALVPFEALLQWVWLAPLVAWLARERAGPLERARAIGLLGAAAAVVATADLAVLGFALWFVW